MKPEDAGGIASTSQGMAQARTSKKLYALEGALLTGLALLLAVAASGFLYLLAVTGNSSSFTAGQRAQAVAIARQAQPIVNALEAYRKETDCLPGNLVKIKPRWLSQEVDSTRYTYSIDDRRGTYRLSPYDSPFLLYYESDAGWLMAEDPDTRPISLGFSP